MAIHNYPGPCAPQYKKPTSVEDCLPHARIFAKSKHGRVAMGPVNKGDNILVITYHDQDEYVREAIIHALKEEGAKDVQFISGDELGKTKPEKISVEDGWTEAGRMENAPWQVAGGKVPAPALKGLYDYLVQHPECTSVFYGDGGRDHQRRELRDQGHKFKNNWLFNNWEEFLSKTWTYPEELWIEIERRIIEAVGKASAVRMTDPEGTHMEYTLTAEEAKRWQMNAWMSGHLLLDPFQATSAEV